MSYMRTIAGMSSHTLLLVVGAYRSHSEQVRSEQANASSAGPLMYTLLLVPRATELCRKVLEDEGLAGDINVAEVRIPMLV